MTLDEEEALARFRTSRVARLATVSAAGVPHLVPVVFAAWSDTVVLAVDHKPKRTRNLKRLANIQANPAVSLLADHYDEDWTRLWWVRVDGTARVIENEPTRTELANGLGEKYEQYARTPPQGPVVEVHITAVSGWKYE